MQTPDIVTRITQSKDHSLLLYPIITDHMQPLNAENYIHFLSYFYQGTYELRHEISNNLVCATSKASDQPAHTRSLIRAFACRLNII